MPSDQTVADVGAVALAAARVKLAVPPLIFCPLRAMVTTPDPQFMDIYSTVAH